MKSLIILCAIVFLALARENSPNRAKRFAGFGSLSSVGGRVGCVVSENSPGNSSLYVNSHFSKYLSEDEIQELEEYKEEIAKFKDNFKTFLEKRQKADLARREQLLRQGFGRGAHESTSSANKDEAKTTSEPALKQPEPPKKPSFCSEKATTQYVFDGCSVQGDSIYIGDNFVRKLTPSEQEELQQFDKQFTAYQKAVTNTFKQQVEGILGKQFGALFDNNFSSSKSTEVPAIESETSTTSNAVGNTSGSAAHVEAPKTPNFCTLIV